ncbi:MAG: ABC transporter permease [Acidimicrobiales bacterium]
MAEAAAAVTEVTLTDRPVPWRAWWADVWSHREVFAILARKEFQTRYKRASFGIVWAVAVPVLQGAVMAFVFSRVANERGGSDYGAYVMGGILAWSYFTTTIGAATTSIVDGSGLADKVWFPRVLLAGVPAAANLVGLVISMVVLVAIAPLLNVDLGLRLLLLAPACVLLVAFTTALGLVLSALHVYFRDTRFVVQAALLVWMWITPIVYRKSLLDDIGDWFDLNPMTGVVALFQQAVAPGDEPWQTSVVIAIAVTVVLVVVGVAAQRRYDRLFVDQL